MSYFKLREFECKCNSKDCTGKQPRLRMNQTLLDALNRIREELGQPIVITSGFRCKNHNKAIGGALNSRHMAGDAVDIRPASGSAEDLEELWKVCEREAAVVGLGDGRRKGFVHIDCRPGTRKVWQY